MTPDELMTITARSELLHKTEFHRQALADVWAQQRKDVPALLAYVEELERRLALKAPDERSLGERIVREPPARLG